MAKKKVKESWFKRALRHDGAEREAAQALVSINYYLELHPDDVPGKIAKAMILNSLSNYDSAQKLLDSIDLDADSPPLMFTTFYNELGTTYIGKNMYEEAADCYDKMIEIKPQRTTGYILKGALLATKGNYQEAKELHLIATKLEGDPDEAFLNLGLIFRAELKLSKAKKAFKKALELTPDYEEAKKELEDVSAAIKLEKELKALRLKGVRKNGKDSSTR